MKVSEKRFAQVLTAVFFILVGWSMSHHEMWRDEVQPWMIVRNIPSLPDVIRFIKYDGHPSLWYVLLYPLARLTPSPAAMQVLHLCLATAVVYVFAAFAPFSRLQRVLFALGYYPFYEYAVKARNYAVGILPLFIYCALSRRRPPFLIPLALLIFLIANSSVYGWLIAAGLTVGFVVEYLLSEAPRRRPTFYIAILIALAGLLLSFVQLIPPADCGFAVKWKKTLDLRYLAHIVNLVPSSFMPFGNYTWNHYLGGGIVKLFLAAGILTFSALLFLATPGVLASYLAASGALFVFYYAKYLGGLRHHGFLFMIFVGCLWMSRNAIKRTISNQTLNMLHQMTERYWSRLFTFILCTQIMTGVAMTARDFAGNYSQAQNAAQYIKSHGLEDRIIVADQDFSLSAVAGYLGKPLYYASPERYGTYIKNDRKRNRKVTQDELVSMARKLQVQEKRKFLIATNYPLGADVQLKYTLQELAQFEPAIENSEVYYFYQDRV